MDKLKDKMKKWKGLSASSLGGGNKAFSGSGHKLGGADPKASSRPDTLA